MDAVEAAVTSYLDQPSQKSFLKQGKLIVCDGLGLPKTAADSPFTVEGLLNFAGDVIKAGDDDLESLRDVNTWNMIRARGLHGAHSGPNEVVKRVFGRLLGVPEQALQRLTLDELLKVTEQAHSRGLDGAVGRPEFWDDYHQAIGNREGLGSFLGRWEAMVEKEEEESEKQADRRLDKQFIEYRHQKQERAKLQDERRRNREEEETKKRKRRKRRKRRGPRDELGPVTGRRAKPRTVVATRTVNFEDGRRWIFTFFSDGSSAVELMDAQGKRLRCWHGRVELEAVDPENPNTPLVNRRVTTIDSGYCAPGGGLRAPGPAGAFQGEQ